MRRRDPRSSGSPRSEVDRLIKQTFSVHVSLPDDRPRGVTRKWHLTAYFSQATLDGLNTIDMIPGVGDVSVPPGWFKNARASKGRAGERPREESPPSWPESWTGVEVPTDPFRPQYPVDAPAMSIQDEKHAWGSATSAPPHGSVNHNHANHHHHPSHHHHHPHHPPPPPPHAQEYYPAQADYGRHHVYDQRSHYYAPPTLPPPSTAAAVHPARLPTLADAGVDGYRDPSPFTSQSSSASSDFGSSPLPATPNYAAQLPQSIPPPPSSLSPHSPPPHSGNAGVAPERNLVPLSVLKTINPPLRDPMAEDCLRRLSNTPRLEARWTDMRATVPSR
ncbi:hypothetical protein BC629DRAFT_898093 [Irpex lacteus]|nr:hypothetical protein BC629DRAFT_898093 [Irpex lacteus]